jgi:hypothetical protein
MEPEVAHEILSFPYRTSAFIQVERPEEIEKSLRTYGPTHTLQGDESVQEPPSKTREELQKYRANHCPLSYPALPSHSRVERVLKNLEPSADKCFPSNQRDSRLLPNPVIQKLYPNLYQVIEH